MTRSFLKGLLLAICFCAAMRSWQYYVTGLNLRIFDLLLFCFSVYFTFTSVAQLRAPRAPRLLQVTFSLLLAIFLYSASTIVWVDLSLQPMSVMQFSKGLLTLALHIYALTAIALYLCTKPIEFRNRILQAYIFGATASAVYSFFEVTLAWYGIDIGRIVWASISTYPPDFDLTRPFYYRWDVFFRAAGFTGVNAQATYTASAVCLVLAARPFRRLTTNWVVAAICIAGTTLTVSRNGFFTLFMGLFIYIIIKPREMLRLVPTFSIAILPVLLIFAFYFEPASHLLSSRLYSNANDFAIDRRYIYDAAWPNVKERPLGHGLNQYYVLTQLTDVVDLDALEVQNFDQTKQDVRNAYSNLHSNWLNWLFEGGWPLASLYLAYYCSVLALCVRSRSRLGVAGICTLVPLMASGLFNMTLDLFSTELLFVLIATLTALEAKQKQAPHTTEPSSVQLGQGST